LSRSKSYGPAVGDSCPRGAVVASVMLMTGDQSTSTVSVPLAVSIVAAAWIFVVNVVIVYWLAGVISGVLFEPSGDISKT
jgi:hypothetical protein